jgi:hypothetical protein
MRTTLICMAVLCANIVYGQAVSAGDEGRANAEREPFAVGEFGGAVNWNLERRGLTGGPTWGPSLGIEFTPIKEWLELELDVSRAANRFSGEWSVDLLFKKPWDISRKLEIMAGVGPEFSRMTEGLLVSHAWGAEAALDLMYWPFKEKRWGFYLEPAYDLTFGVNGEQSIGINAGLLVGIR